jgi:hypothetical protein
MSGYKNIFWPLVSSSFLFLIMGVAPLSAHVREGEGQHHYQGNEHHYQNGERQRHYQNGEHERHYQGSAQRVVRPNGVYERNNSTVVVPENNNENDDNNWDPNAANPQTQGAQIFDDYDQNNR